MAYCPLVHMGVVGVPLNTETRNRLPSFLPSLLVEEACLLQLAKGDRLFTLGDPVKEIYFVVEGELKAVRYLVNGRECIMLRSQAGEFFGESALVVEAYVCDALSTRDSSIVSIPAIRFRELLKNDSGFASAFALQMAAHARCQCARYERLRLSRARDRVVHLLSCEANKDGIYQYHGPQTDLADDLGLEPETLYRVLKELQQEGVISRSKGALQILANPR